VVVVWDCDVGALEASTTRAPLNGAVRRGRRGDEPGKACSEEVPAGEHLGAAGELSRLHACPT
jgi:hypothetical protein